MYLRIPLNYKRYVLPLNSIGTVKIEFSNSELDIRHLFLAEINVNGDNLIFDLRVDAVQCKAISRGGSCGTTDSGEECCASAEKPKVQIINLAASAETCAPGSGCC